MSNGLVEGRMEGGKLVYFLDGNWEIGILFGWKLGNWSFFLDENYSVHIMFSWIPLWQIVGIGGTGETWEASMKCELDALSHGHEECEFNNVVMICGETWELNYSRIQQRMVTCH